MLEGRSRICCGRSSWRRNGINRSGGLGRSCRFGLRATFELSSISFRSAFTGGQFLVRRFPLGAGRPVAAWLVAIVRGHFSLFAVVVSVLTGTALFTSTTFFPCGSLGAGLATLLLVNFLTFTIVGLATALTALRFARSIVSAFPTVRRGFVSVLCSGFCFRMPLSGNRLFDMSGSFTF